MSRYASKYGCPSCGCNQFEKRGEQRTYHPLTAELELDGWDGGEVTIDTDDDGEDVIYCVGCDGTFKQSELKKRVEA